MLRRSELPAVTPSDPGVPMIYDVYWDKIRPVTQADVDQLVRVANVWEGMQRFVKQKHDELVSAIPTSPNIGHG